MSWKGIIFFEGGGLQTGRRDEKEQVGIQITPWPGHPFAGMQNE